MALLTQQEVQELANAIVSAKIYPQERGVLMQFVHDEFLARIPNINTTLGQVMTDLGWMNEFERIANGDVPLLIYLQNAAFVVSSLSKESLVVRKMLEKVQERALGMPVVDITTVQEINEAIIHTDDTLPYSFINGASKAAASVAKICMYAFDKKVYKKLPSGDKIVFNGSGWLISNTLMVTNHHVINARKKGEHPATDEELVEQVEHSYAIMDLDDDFMQGATVNFKKLEAWSAQLDYAIIRTETSNRPGLKISSNGVGKIMDPVPVNIIQHPGGRSKRFAIRNNLVSSSQENELRYFTDTDAGSSGSPVFDDVWEVVALHRASVYTGNVKFQGKTTAYVNVGTQISSIMKDIEQRYPALYQEIAEG
jgi:endonuclease G